MRYLRDRFREGKDDQIEDWAKEQNHSKLKDEYFAEDLQKPKADVQMQDDKVESMADVGLRSSFSHPQHP